MNKTYSLTLIALGAALVAALSPFQIPLGPIPITLQTLAIGLIATIYRPKEATLAIILYLLLGAIGLPVFAGGKGGFGTNYRCRRRRQRLADALNRRFGHSLPRKTESGGECEAKYQHGWYRRGAVFLGIQGLLS